MLMAQVLLGLLSVWNVSFLGSPARVRFVFDNFNCYIRNGELHLCPCLVLAS